jgi:hypothetical protein
LLLVPLAQPDTTINRNNANVIWRMAFFLARRVYPMG